MLVISCIDRKRNKKNEITHYCIQDKFGNTKTVTASALKQAIINKQVICTNLELTSDNRLILKEDTNRIVDEQKRKNEVVKKNFISGEKKLNTANVDEYDLSDEEDNNGCYFGTRIRTRKFEIIIEVNYSEDKKQAHVYMKDIVSDNIELAESIQLKEPLYSDENIKRISVMLDTFAGKFKRISN